MDPGELQRVLIVEDDPAFGRLLEEVAVEIGLRPSRCATAEDAWTAYQRDAHPIVLTDWALPGEDGLSLCRRIRDSPAGGRTVTTVITGRHQAQEIQAVLEAGASDYILKSSDPATLEIRLGLAARHARALAAQAEAEAATASSELRFSAVATNVPVAILRADVSGACTFANESWESLAGRPRTAAIGDGWLAAVHPHDQASLRAAWDTLVRDGTGFRGEARLVAGDGRLRWGAWTGVPLRRGDGRTEGHLVTVSDISDRVAIDETTRAREERFELAGRGWAIGVWDWDVVTDRLTCTERLVEMAGWGLGRPAPLTARAFLELVHPRDRTRVSTWVRAHLDRHEPYSVDFRMLGPSGRWRWFNSRGHAVWNEAGVPVRMAGLMRDITAGRRVERMLRRAHRAETHARRQAQARAAELERQAADLERARNAALESTRLKSEFLATMSHELRTPLNGVIGMTGLLLDTPLSEDQREFADHARAAGIALLDLINDILDLSRIEAGHLELDDAEVDVAALVDEVLMVVAERAETRGLELGAIVDPTLGIVAGDLRRVRQVLVNLLGNATKFTERGGVLVRVDVTARDTGTPRLRVAVEDTGPGIAPADVARLFQPFVQVDGTLARRHGGTGLGLAISRRLVEAMGGQIGVTSEPGAGSVFWFELPVRTITDASPARAPGAADALCLTTGAVTRDVLRARLAALGYRVDVLEDAASLLDRLETGAYGVVVVDQAHTDADRVLAVARVTATPRVVLLTTLGHRGALPPGVLRVRKPLRSSSLRALRGDAVRPPAAVPAVPAPAPAVRPLRVLVAEDNVTNQMLVRIHLERLGHDARLVRDGRAAVESARAEQYDLILMDCEMPEMDGLEATQHIRRHERAGGGHTPIVALTANAMQDDRERCLAAGMDDYVTKPLQPHVLAEVIARHVVAAGEPVPAVDESVVTRLRETLSADQATFATLIETFLTDVEATRREVRSALEATSGARLARAAHALKSTSATMGARRLADLCAELERAGRHASAHEWPPLVGALDDEASRVSAHFADRSGR